MPIDGTRRQSSLQLGLLRREIAPIDGTRRQSSLQLGLLRREIALIDGTRRESSLQLGLLRGDEVLWFDCNGLTAAQQPHLVE